MISHFTGRRMATILIAFFGVVVAVNVTMATLATRTFGGVVVQNSYVASQQFNEWLSAAKRQEQLGWKVAASLGSDRRVRVTLTVRGAEVSGFARHPLGREKDLPLRFRVGSSGEMLSEQPLPTGRWLVHLLVRKDKDEARLIEELS